MVRKQVARHFGGPRMTTNSRSGRGPQRIALALLFLVIAFTGSTSLLAQFNASLSGTITDPTGAVVPGATVTLKNSGTQATRSDVTGQQGTYQFSELPPGTYSLTATAKGFQLSSLDNVTLIAETPRNIDLHLTVGESNQTTTVSVDQVPTLTTSTPTIA